MIRQSIRSLFTRPQPPRALPRRAAWIGLTASGAAAAPYLLGPFQLNLLNIALAWAIAALGVNLLFGYAGRLSLGHAAYFGLGAYTGGFVFRFTGVMSVEVYIAAGTLMATAAAALFGYLSTRHTRLYFSILTFAFGMLVHTLILYGISYFAFFNGVELGFAIHLRRPTLFGLSLGPLSFVEFQRLLYYVILLCFVLALWIMRRVVQSPFGLALRAIRENEVRAIFVGVPVRRYIWAAFILSGALAGLGGALNSLTLEVAAPRQTHWLTSLEVVVMVVLGGSGYLLGPVAGALGLMLLRYVVDTIERTLWGFVMGAIIILLTLTFPRGLFGIVESVPWLRRLRSAA